MNQAEITNKDELFNSIILQLISNNEVNKKINNPLTWVSAVGVLLFVVLSLSGAIYFANQDDLLEAITGNSHNISQNNANFSDLKNTVQEISANQRIITGNIDRLLVSQKNNSDFIFDIHSTRVKPNDLENAIKPFKAMIESMEKINERLLARTNTNEDGLLQNKQRINFIDEELKDRKSFMSETKNSFNDLNNRIRKLEYSNQN